jgi:hypothetical protein
MQRSGYFFYFLRQPFIPLSICYFFLCGAVRNGDSGWTLVMMAVEWRWIHAGRAASSTGLLLALPISMIHAMCLSYSRTGSQEIGEVINHGSSGSCSFIVIRLGVWWSGVINGVPNMNMVTNDLGRSFCSFLQSLQINGCTWNRSLTPFKFLSYTCSWSQLPSIRRYAVFAVERSH